ncbi:MAG: hypothetical protein DDT22_00827 [candidate division WS2 bacterium]|nr:hypothetical protein [Candidatus Lithacetigena glycinireducens]
MKAKEDYQKTYVKPEIKPIEKCARDCLGPGGCCAGKM